MYRTAKESFQGRVKKKTTGKTTWYKKKRKKETGDESHETKEREKSRNGEKERKGKKKLNGGSKEKEDMKVAAVIFVENTKDEALAKEMREILERQKIILGFRIKVVERSGTQD